MTSPDAAAVPARRTYRLAPAILLGIGLVVVAIDQLTKWWAVEALQTRAPVEVIGETVRLLLVRNPGAAFSFGTDATIVFGVISSVVVAGLVLYAFRVRSKWWTWGLGLVLGGAAGNLIDRIFRYPGGLEGHVVDFVSIGWWPVFNVADSCLIAGVITLLVASVIGEDPKGWRDSDAKGEAAAGEAAERERDAEGEAAADSENPGAPERPSDG